MKYIIIFAVGLIFNTGAFASEIESKQIEVKPSKSNRPVVESADLINYKTIVGSNSVMLVSPDRMKVSYKFYGDTKQRTSYLKVPDSMAHAVAHKLCIKAGLGQVVDINQSYNYNDSFEEIRFSEHLVMVADQSLRLQQVIESELPRLYPKDNTTTEFYSITCGRPIRGEEKLPAQLSL